MEILKNPKLQQLLKFFSYSPRQSLSHRRSVKRAIRRSERINARESALLQRRNIVAMEPETPGTPNCEDVRHARRESRMEQKRKSLAKNAKNKEVKVDRLTLLQRWKAEKEERLKKQKAVEKPVFRVGGTINIGFPGVNTLPSAPKAKQFKAPVNVKPIDLKPPLKISQRSFNKLLNFNNKSQVTEVRVTRSQKNITASTLASQRTVASKAVPQAKPAAKTITKVPEKATTKTNLNVPVTRPKTKTENKPVTRATAVSLQNKPEIKPNRSAVKKTSVAIKPVHDVSLNKSTVKITQVAGNNNNNNNKGGS